MNVLFVVPPFPNRVSEYLILPSIEVCIMAQILMNHDHDVHMLDMKIDNMDPVDAIGTCDYSPDYVCIDDEPKTHCISKKVILLLREKFGSSVKIVMRGEISSFIPRNVMKRNQELDYIIRYDDDYALLNIIEAGTDQGKLMNIHNIAFRNAKGEISVTDEEACNYDLNELPKPFRKLYDVKKYLQRDPETIVKSSRGCPGKCLFCIKTKFEPFRLFSIQRFCDEIQDLQAMGFQSFFFSDDTFSFSDKRVDEFCDEIQKRGMKVRWTSNMRICDINEHKISRMKEAGAYRVFVGIETINDESQRIIHKNLSKDTILKKIQIIKDFGLEFHASFILGNPGDTEADVERTMQFAKMIQPTVVTFNLIRVYPGLDLYNNPETYHIIMNDPYWYEKDEWTSRVVMGTEELPPTLLEKLCRKCLWEFTNG